VKKRIFLLIILFSYFIYGDGDIHTPFSRYNLDSGIDSPTGYILPHGNFYFSQVINYDLKSSYSQENNLTYSLSFGLYDRVQLNVSHYQSRYIGLNLLARIIEEDRFYHLPTVFLGIDNIGGDDQLEQYQIDFFDKFSHLPKSENYTLDFEKNSIYMGISKRINFGKQFIRATLGYSPMKGRFKGFGPKNFYLNNTFFSVEYSPFYNIRLIFEQDARDWNFGGRFILNRIFSFNMAVTEIEHLDDWIGGAFHIGIGIYLVPNFIAIKQRKQEYDQLVQSRIEEAERLDQLYQELVKKRIMLENKYNTIRLNIERILKDQRYIDRKLFYEKELLNESEYYIRVALELHYLGDTDKAIEYCKKAIQTYPKNPFAYLRLGDIYIKQGNKDKAIQIWKEGLLTVPDDGNLLEAIKRYGDE